MRKSICIGQILRSDESVGAKGTLATFLMLGYAARQLEIDIEYCPISGMTHGAGRDFVLADFLQQRKSDDLLFIDFGNGVAAGDDYSLILTLLSVLLTSRTEFLVCPCPKRDEVNPDSSQYNVQLIEASQKSIRENLSFETLPELGTGDPNEKTGVHLLKVHACGFAFVRLMRSAARKVWEHQRGIDPYLIPDPETGRQVEAAGCFRDVIKHRHREAEDFSFCARARELGIYPHALVDFPTSHGWRVPGVNHPMFRAAIGLGAVTEALPTDSEPEPKSSIILTN